MRHSFVTTAALIVFALFAATLAAATAAHAAPRPPQDQFPANFVPSGPGVAAHGSSDMPTWGALFQYMDNYNRASVEKRIKNLTDYLATLQDK